MPSSMVLHSHRDKHCISDHKPAQESNHFSPQQVLHLAGKECAGTSLKEEIPSGDAKIKPAMMQLTFVVSLDAS